MATKGARTKGAIVRPMVEWFAGACGEAELRDVAAALSPGARDEIAVEAPAFGILPAGWYSETLASELADAILKRAMQQYADTFVLKALGAHIVDRTLGRFSRAAVEWMATPLTIAAAAPIFWRMYHESGAVQASVDGSSMSARCVDWSPHGQTWCRVVGASAVRVLDLAGCREARVWVHRCRGNAPSLGDGSVKVECSLVFRWQGIDAPPRA
jgi:hypothetical protein